MDTKGAIFDNIITSSEAYILEELSPSTEYIVQVTHNIRIHFPKKYVSAWIRKAVSDLDIDPRGQFFQKFLFLYFMSNKNWEW